MYPKHLAPMPMSEVSLLKVGDKVHIYYAKDGDEDDERYNEVVEVIEVGNGFIVADERWDIKAKNWFSEAQKSAYEKENAAYTARGCVYFFYPPVGLYDVCTGCANSKTDCDCEVDEARAERISLRCSSCEDD